MLVVVPDAEVARRAVTDARLALIGGAPIDGERHFVEFLVKLHSEDRTGHATSREPASRSMHVVERAARRPSAGRREPTVRRELVGSGHESVPAK